MKKLEALKSIQGVWDEFSRLTGFVPPPISKSPPPAQNPTATKRKTNLTDDGFIHPTKSSKNLISKAKDTPKFGTNNKFEILSNMSDDCSDIDNTNVLPPEPKPQLYLYKDS